MVEVFRFSNYSKSKSFPISNFENNNGGNRRWLQAKTAKSPHDSLAIGGLQEAKVQNRRRRFQCHKGHYNGKWGTRERTESSIQSCLRHVQGQTNRQTGFRRKKAQERSPDSVYIPPSFDWEIAMSHSPQSGLVSWQAFVSTRRDWKSS